MTSEEAKTEFERFENYDWSDGHEVYEGAETRSDLAHSMLRAVAEAAANTCKKKRARARAGATTNDEIKANASLGNNKDYVSDIDTSNQRIIFGMLNGKFPSVHSYGEELGQDHAKEAPNEGDRQWVLDPIDSTRNLISGTPLYSISLGCQEFRRGRWVTIAGVVGIPDQQKLIWAERGKGAFVVEPCEWPFVNGSQTPVHIKKHFREGAAAFEERAVEFCVVKELLELEMPLISQLHGKDRRAIRMCDSGAYSAAQTGLGFHGMFTGGLTEHDKTAALLIAHEAGAVIETFDIEPKAEHVRKREEEEAKSGKPDTQWHSRHQLHLIASDEPMLREMHAMAVSALQQMGRCFSAKPRVNLMGDFCHLEGQVTNRESTRAPRSLFG